MIVWECLISLYSFDRAMANDGNGPDLRESLSRQITSAIPLGKGQGRVLPLSLESGIAGVFTVFDPAKKRLERQIDANRHGRERPLTGRWRVAYAKTYVEREVLPCIRNAMYAFSVMAAIRLFAFP